MESEINIHHIYSATGLVRGIGLYTQSKLQFYGKDGSVRFKTSESKKSFDIFPEEFPVPDADPFALIDVVQNEEMDDDAQGDADFEDVIDEESSSSSDVEEEDSLELGMAHDEEGEDEESTDDLTESEEQEMEDDFDSYFDSSRDSWSDSDDSEENPEDAGVPEQGEPEFEDSADSQNPEEVQESAPFDASNPFGYSSDSDSDSVEAKSVKEIELEADIGDNDGLPPVNPYKNPDADLSAKSNDQNSDDLPPVNPYNNP